MAGGGNSQFSMPGQLGQGVKGGAPSAASPMGSPMASQFGQSFGGAGRFTQFNPGVQRNTFVPQQYAAPQMSPGTPQMQPQGVWNPRAPRGAGYDGMGTQWMPGGQPGELMHDNGFTGAPQTAFGSGLSQWNAGPSQGAFGALTPWGSPGQPQTNPGRDIGIFGRRGPWNEVM